jgi:uncharacterized glyoxalase superfamily protein PhnB
VHPTTHLKLLPYLFYEDPAAAVDWLAAAFGFSERFRLALPNGSIAHAELQLGHGVVMIGNVGPRNRDRPTAVRSSVYVFVEDVDAHYERARAAGAVIVEEPADQPFGDRIYLAKDLEGHEWYFAQHVRDVQVAELARLMSQLKQGSRPTSR